MCMSIRMEEWKKHWKEISKECNGEMKISRVLTCGEAWGDQYIIEIDMRKVFEGVTVEQNATGFKFSLDYGDLPFYYSSSRMDNYAMSIYKVGYFEKRFGKRKVKSGNKEFDDIYGIYTTDSRRAERLFSNSRVQKMFLKNQKLKFVVQKTEPRIIFDSRKSKLFNAQEFQSLLDDFIYILKILNS